MSYNPNDTQFTDRGTVASAPGTPNQANPGYVDFSSQQSIKGTPDPVTGFIPSQTVTVIQTRRQDGTVAYTTTIKPDGTKEVTGVGSEVGLGQMGDIATPDGPGFKRTDGSILNNDQLTPHTEKVTPGDAVSTWKAGGYDPTTLVNGINTIKKASETANLVGIVTGTQAPGFNNDKITNNIDTIAVKAAGGGDAGLAGAAAAPPPAAPPPGAADLNAFKPGASSGAPPITSTPATAPTIGAGPHVTAPTVTAPKPVAPPSIDFNTGLVQAGHIDQAPTVGSVGQVTAPVLGPGQQIQAGQVSAGSIAGSTPLIGQSTAAPVNDIAVGGPGRDAQITALGQLNDIATGKTKTAADWLLQKGIDKNVGAAYGLAASLQGRNPGVALRTGAITAKDAIAASAADVAAQKAQEQQKAASDYAALGTSIAGQDLAALQSNQSKDLQLSVTNLNAKIEVQKANQQTQLEEGKADLAAQTATSIADLQAQVQTQVANLQASTARDIANQTAQLDASKANAANEVAVKIQDSINQMSVLKANLEAETAANNTNAVNTTQKQIAELNNQTTLLQQQQDQLFQAAKDTAANKLSASQSDAANATTRDVANATNATTTANANASLAEKAQADQAAQDARLKQLGLDQLIAQLNYQLSVAKTDVERQAANDAFNAAVLQIGGTIASAYIKRGGGD